MTNLLCIEDNPEIRILVEGSLDGYRVVHAATLKDARGSLEQEHFDMILLDLELPDGDGLKFLAELGQERADVKDIPVFILTAKAEVANKVIAFSLGADDFIGKPFDPTELRARVGAKLRKIEKSRNQSELLRLKELSIDIPRQRVFLNKDGHQTTLTLTSIELKMLITFARAPDRVFSRNQLLDQVWGSDVSITDRTVDTHIAHLRKKIADSSVRIETVFNEGYRLLP